MRPINNVELYESLKFDCCPHCGEITPPVFSIEDYIKNFAEKIKEFQDQGAGPQAGRQA